MARKAPKQPAPHTMRERDGRSVDRLAAGVNPAARTANLIQLRRARGQIEGIERMLEQDRPCADIIVQITASRASLQVVAQDLLASHLRVCHATAASNTGRVAERMRHELVQLVSNMAR